MAYYGQTINTGNKDVYLRDFTHASRIFTPASFDLAPKFKFLFHTYFAINTEAYTKNVNTGDNFGLLVKTVKLPSFNIKTAELNQYNRKRIVQTKISYDPVNITFHDDSSNMITKLWDAYYTYYYKDSTNMNDLFEGIRSSENSSTPRSNIQLKQNYNERNIYNGNISGQNNWGYTGESYRKNVSTKAPFFKNITIFGFNRHRFTAYTLINPMITKVDHDTYNYSEGSGTMEIKIDINYETVVYNEGVMDGMEPSAIVTGFGLDASYDRKLSPNTRQGAQSYYGGKTGYEESSGGFIDKYKGQFAP